MRAFVLAATSTTVLLTSSMASAYCPSYTASSPNNQYGCAIEAVAGQNPTTAEWNSIFDLVSRGPSVWGDAGPTVQDISQGCGKPEPLHTVPARFPCELLKGITMQESWWTHFCVPDMPSDQVGGASRTIISFDCGYGIAQVTSGMHVGENPGFDRDRVAADPTYNLATGTRILAAKWAATQCVGDNQPAVIEHWYEATWAYNGLAYVNNPNNPNYNPGRGVWNPQVGGAAPYQEKVFGWIEYPGGQFTSTALAYPNPGDIGGGSSPPVLPDPACASPTDCVNSRSIHWTQCDGQVGTGGAGGMGQGGGGGNPSGGGFVGNTGGSGGSSAQDDKDTYRSRSQSQVSCTCRFQDTVEGPSDGGRLGLLGILLATLGLRRIRRRRLDRASSDSFQR